MSESKEISIREHSVKYTIVIFMVIFVASILHYLVYSEYLHSLQKKEYQKTLVQSANNVSRLLKFYQSVVDDLASLPAVIDLLQFGTNEETQAWANNMQRLLPESIGLALFDAHANVKGIKSELRLSDKCITDMNRRFKKELISLPPVHYEIQELAHYDISSPIIIDGEQIGVVFASFSLETLRRLLTDLENENQGLRITTADGYEIASVGKVDNKTDSVVLYNKKIDETDWNIELAVEEVEKNVLVTSLFVSNIVTFILLSMVLYFAISRLFSVVVSDYEIISWLMQKIREGTYDPKENCAVSLLEAKDIFRFIQYTAKELDTYQRKLKTDSTTDELTGLHNRRELNSGIENCLLLADQGQSLYVVILDLDHFKAINDTFGHDVGDEVLVFLSKAMKKHAKKEDLCTRAGGDEFIVILKNYGINDVKLWYENVSKEMFENINQYNKENNVSLKFGVSAGCTLIRNSDRKSTVLKRADEALYRVKENGGNKLECL